ncbi:Serine/threonine-protein kinase OSR1 [Fasciola hepatica]|uniref:Serine/threonine-protein kinase OSR1 n=1 Tax=Fasciola hepatica TaxID=6192 RepID=A0A4E0QYI9_FASHE|nr:Serine/threonine-protein kinase OSR1 [Fasciola hepatica]
MICEEVFMSTVLDVPIKGDHIHMVNKPAVEHSCDLYRKKWLRIVNLELCDRADLSSLMANINFLQKLASVRLNYGEIDSDPKELDDCLCLPSGIELVDTQVTFSYPLSPFGSVHDYLHHYSRPLDEASISVLFSRAVHSLAQLHSRGVLHRNLSTKHLLLTEKRNPSNADELKMQLCGLGSLTQFPLRCNILRNDLPPIHVSWRGWRLADNESVVKSAHPMAWYSPELVGQDFVGYSWPSDIYSLGWILFELCTKREPYAGLTPIQIVLQKLLSPRTLKIEMDWSSKYSGELIQVFKACTCRNPEKRPTANQLLEMPWVQKGLTTKLKRSLLM